MSEHRLTAIEEAVDVGIVGESADGTITSWNRAAHELLGYAPESMIGQPALVLVPVYRAEEERERRQRVLAGATERLVTQLVGADRKPVDVELTLAPVADDSGAIVGCVSILRDLSQQKLAEDRLGRLAFADRMASLGTLAAGVAHEINNPLAFITANLDMLEQELRALHGGDGWDEIIAMVHDARDGSERIKKVVRGIMTFARPDEDQRTPLALDRVLDLAIHMAGAEIRHRAKLVRRFTSVPVVLANEARLGQVFCNLLLNAAEAIPPGQADRHEIRVTTDADSHGRAIVEIIDTGRGITADIQARVFDPFFTTKPVGEGLGLGLTICHAIVSSLGGTLTFRSMPGVGTTFRVVLAPCTQPLPARPPLTIVPPGTKRGRVLIVDDEIVFASSLRRFLARDHEVTVVHSGREAIERLEAGLEVDAILCDLMMPDLTGVDVHQHLSEHHPEVARRMIFLTGGASPTMQQFLDRIGNRWFEKPCDLDELRATIRKLVG